MWAGSPGLVRLSVCQHLTARLTPHSITLIVAHLGTKDDLTILVGALSKYCDAQCGEQA